MVDYRSESEKIVLEVQTEIIVIDFQALFRKCRELAVGMGMLGDIVHRTIPETDFLRPAFRGYPAGIRFRKNLILLLHPFPYIAAPLVRI